jgi:general secretion pathway protein K
LLAVKGFTPEVYEALAPHVAALPALGQPTKINVNTATPEVLKSLGPNVTDFDLANWKEAQDTGGYKDLVAFQAAGTAIDQAMLLYLDVTTNYFGVSVITSIGTTRLSMYSLLERNGKAVTSRLRNFDIISQPDCEQRRPEGQ